MTQTLNAESVGACERALGVDFVDHALLAEALTHSSAVERGEKNNERLEFLGDAVLELVVSEWLFGQRDSDNEGLLTQRRSRLVRAPALAQLARQIDLGSWIVLSTGEERCGGRDKRSVLANAVEALLGAIYLDRGLAAARDWVLPHLAALDTAMDQVVIADAKNRLQELLQGRGEGLPTYRVTGEDGPAHAKTFTVECWIGEELFGLGSGSSKRRAERVAADAALEKLATGDSTG